jgi:hypothetical protein
MILHVTPKVVYLLFILNLYFLREYEILLRLWFKFPRDESFKRGACHSDYSIYILHWSYQEKELLTRGCLIKAP